MFLCHVFCLLCGFPVSILSSCSHFVWLSFFLGRSQMFLSRSSGATQTRCPSGSLFSRCVCGVSCGAETRSRLPHIPASSSMTCFSRLVREIFSLCGELKQVFLYLLISVLDSAFHLSSFPIGDFYVPCLFFGTVLSEAWFLPGACLRQRFGCRQWEGEGNKAKEGSVMSRYHCGPLGPGPVWERAAFILQLCPSPGSAVLPGAFAHEHVQSAVRAGWVEGEVSGAWQGQHRECEGEWAGHLRPWQCEAGTYILFQLDARWPSTLY